jgi:hypothetical protein
MGTAIRICQRSAAAQRLWIALVISLFVHYLAVQGWQGGGARSTAEVPLLKARLERLPMVAAVAAPEILDVVESRDTLQPQAVRPVQQIPSPPSTTPAAGKINGAADARFYSARELDRYPVPLAPLVAPTVADSISLWVSIDHIGQVVDVAVVDAGSHGMPEQIVRDMLLASRFEPARKNGRQVKSRVLLVLRQ